MIDMDKIARIRQEIERQMKFYDEKEMKAWDDSEQGDEDALWYQGHRKMCAKLLTFLDTLSEEPDKSLEEAAEEYANINCDNYVDYDCNICYIEEGMRVAFKAGAEWQKEQDNYDTIFYKGMMYYRKRMMEEAVEGEAEELYNDGESQCVVSVGTYFEPGDKVYVLKAEEE